MSGRQDSPHRFVFVRHAEAACNVMTADAVIERYDPHAPLTCRGRIQAETLAREMPEALVGDPVFSSPLRRALDTATPLARRHARSVRCDARLEEMSATRVFSPPLSLAAWDDLLDRRVAEPAAEVAPGIEPLAVQDERVRAFLRDRHERRDGDPLTLVVAHAFSIELAIIALLGLSTAVLTSFRLRLSNAAIHVVENDQLGRPSRLLLVNAQNHFGRWL